MQEVTFQPCALILQTKLLTSGEIQNTVLSIMIATTLSAYPPQVGNEASALIHGYTVYEVQFLARNI